MILCRNCNEFKEDSQFRRKPKKRQTDISVCRSCESHQTRLRKHNLTELEFSGVYYNQNKSCAICKIELSLTDKSIMVDHCHKTNKVRGLLCLKCNTGIGLLNDDITILQSAINYIKD